VSASGFPDSVRRRSPPASSGGKSNREIAALLFITAGTVKSHLHAVIGKLDASDRPQAVTIALKRGLLRL
jgi:two-component system NarL family response regulator